MDDWKLKAQVVVEIEKECNMFVSFLIYSSTTICLLLFFVSSTLQAFYIAAQTMLTLLLALLSSLSAEYLVTVVFVDKN